MVSAPGLWLAAALTVAGWTACADTDGEDPIVADAGGDAAIDAADSVDGDTDTADGSAAPEPPPEGPFTVQVTLDGEPVAGVRVQQGGNPRWAVTDENGVATVELDRRVQGDWHFVASHPDARQRASELVAGPATNYTIALQRFDRTDNPNYLFQDPGEPLNSPTTSQCGHCHQTINRSWFSSVHRTAARNPRVHELYAGTIAAATQEACEAAGGAWTRGREPGSGEPIDRCYLGDGALQAYNPPCGDGACDELATNFGDCAGCHAPAINGELVGRDLLEAKGIAYQYGVSCDVCHRVEDVILGGPPGVHGALRLQRPSEPGPSSLGAGGLLPLSFGPSHDVPNPRMGVVQRDHYTNGELCSGCHQHDAAPPPSVGTVDLSRFPEGTLPIQSTWQEWLDGPFGNAAACNSCHMSPNPTAANSQDVNNLGGVALGIPGGWLRAPGTVRLHDFIGPRANDDRMLRNAATVTLQSRREADTLVVQATVRNTGAGHAIPTGEALRSLILLVGAWCSDTPVPPAGGDVIDDLGGARAERLAADGFERWPGLASGARVRFARTVGYHDYRGFGPFGDGRFDATQRGWLDREWVGELVVESVTDDVVRWALPESLSDSGANDEEIARILATADVAWAVDATTWPDRDAALQTFAGLPGVAFARVMVDAEGRRQVPHYRAVDIASDNRLLPTESWTSEHRFAAGCETPTVRATLLYRPFPWWLDQQRDWQSRDRIMLEVQP